MRPMTLPIDTANQNAPSAPATMPVGDRPTIAGNSVMVAVIAVASQVTRPILFATLSVNHRLPSAAAARPTGPLAMVGIGYSLMVPAVGSSRPMLLAPVSVNQIVPSLASAMPDGLLPLRIGYSVKTGRGCPMPD